jgi:hypothetical protein
MEGDERTQGWFLRLQYRLLDRVGSERMAVRLLHLGVLVVGLAVVGALIAVAMYVGP